MSSITSSHVIRFLLLILLLTVAVHGYAQTGSQKKIRVVMDDNYPPYVFKGDQGELKGIIVDQWWLWEKKTGIAVELTGTDWSEAQRRMQAGEFDVIDTLFRSAKREAIYDFTKPYAQIDVPLFFHDDISGISGPEDLKGFLVAVKAGDNSIDILKKHGVDSIDEYPSYEKLLEAARDGKAKIFTVDRPPALYYLNKMGIQNRYHETKPLYHGEFHRAVLKGKRDILSTVENGFDSVSRRELDAIDKRWMGTDVASIPMYRYAFYGACAIAVLLLLLTLWLRALRRTVFEKTVELTTSKEMLTLLMRYSPVYVFIKEVTPTGSRVLQASENFQEMVGIAGSNMIGKTMEELFPAEFAAKITADDRTVIAQGEILKIDEELNERSYSTIKFPLVQGDKTLLAGYTIDITDRKKAEEALRESEATFRKLFEGSSDPILLIDSTGVFVECNQAALDLLKMSREQFLFQSPVNISPEYQANGRRSDEAAPDMIAQAFSKGLHRFDWSHINAEGGTFIVEISLMPITIKGETMLHTAWRDITERKQSERELLYSTSLAAAALESTPDGILIVNRDGKIARWNQKFVDLWHVPQHLLDCTVKDPVLEYATSQMANPEEFLANVMELYEHPEASSADTLYLADGRVFERYSQPQRVGDEIVGRFWSFRDITERKQTEEQLRASEECFKALAEASFGGIIIHDKGLILECNKGLTNITGFGYEEHIGMNGLELIAPESLDTVLANIRSGYDKNYEVIGVRKDGSKYPLAIRGKNIVYKGRDARVIEFRDISENKRSEEEKLLLEKQLLHAQKLESLGVLAGGIAHDFNNILMAIIGNADLALMRINKESPATENLHRIELAAARAADLAKQMLAYSGKGKFVVENIDLNILLEDMLHMLEVSISKKAVLRLNLHTPLPSVEADATQMRQVIMNLVINASEAIGDRSGVIAITSGCMDCDRNYLKDVWLDENITAGLYVYLEIADTGCGMDKATLSKLFDPFFTTKFTGRGLGMAAVLGIVRGHKGAIKVYSELNRGTTFKILLPASDRPAELFNGHSHDDDWKGTGTILLIDDEETVRGVGREMLQELGFTVLTAEDGRDGIAVFKENPDISFVILDLTMPHMDGEQCFRELRQLKPDVKVIMSSGYSEQEVGQKFIGKGLAGFIQKPYKLSTLMQTIKNIS